MRIDLSAPDINENDIASVTEVLRSGRLSLGPVLEEFEQRFAEYIGTQHAVAVSSGTAALHLCMVALELHPGEEIITTPFSFIASANCALMVGAVPVFVDIDDDTWNMDASAISRVITNRTRAILPVHIFGVPARMDLITEIALSEGLAVIEDACEAVGARYAEQAVGTFGDAATFAFYPNKQMTTGEGGMLVTDQETLASMARSLRNQGRDHMNSWLTHPRLGYNYRLSEINAALGVSQLSRIGNLLQRREQVAQWYLERLKSDERLVLQQAPREAHVSRFVFVVRLGDEYCQADRDDIIRQLHNSGIGCSTYFTPIHLQTFYRERFGYSEGDFPKCEHVAARTMALPFHPKLTEDQVDEVCRELQALL